MTTLYTEPRHNASAKERAVPPAIAHWLRAAESVAAGRWHTPKQMASALASERARACRTGEAFSLLVFHWLRPDPDRAGVHALRELLTSRLRVTDQAGWLNERSVGALLPFADAEGAHSIVQGLMTAYPEHLSPLGCDIYYSEGSNDWKAGTPSPWESQGSSPHFPLPLGADHAATRVSFESMKVLFSGPPEWWKRGLDIVVAALGLILFMPLLLLAMFLIRLVSPGPALFRQQRAGRGGVPFTIYKLRTMQMDAEARKAELMALNEQDGPAFKLTHDPRLIPVIGRLLRSTSIDELPQLLNVLKGDMSLVGPRPLPLSEAAQCEVWQMQRLDVVPGLTGPWQVMGRSRTSFVRWVRMDLGYIRKRSFLYDLTLLLKTIPAVIKGTGAH